MISFVKGTVAFTDNEYIVLENHGIGYRIRAAAGTLNKVSSGQELMLYTHFYVREDTMALFGFETREELAVFRLLLGINGIGPKVAISVLSVLTVQELYYAVFSDDVRTLAKTPGIGPKGAKRMIMELKDKLRMEDLDSVAAAEGDTDGMSSAATASSDQMTDTIEALIALGYSNGDAYRAVHKVPGAEGMDSGQLLKKALQVIASK